MKAKKIGIKFYLDKRKDNATGYVDDHGEGIVYPVYVQVTYKRNNTKFRIKHKLSFKNMEEVKKMVPSLMPFSERIIRMIIQRELEIRGERFDVKGLNVSYKSLSKSVHTVLSDYLLSKFDLKIKGIAPAYWSILNFEPDSRTFFSIYQLLSNTISNLDEKIGEKRLKEIIATKRYYTIYENKSRGYMKNAEWFSQGLYGYLFPDEFNYPAIIDWIYGNEKQRAKEELNKENLSEVEIDSTISTIDKIIQLYIKD